jgi:arylsulfatase A-like enzyme
LTLLALIAVGALAGGSAAHVAKRVTRPNIVVIETDDQTSEGMKVLKQTQRLIGRAGTTFDNSFVSYSLCCPSRATFLTGQYAHNHGVLNNDPPDGGYYKLRGANTLPVWLRRAGYYTALVGKYLNHYGNRNPLEIPPGWNEFHSLVDPSTYNYFGYEFNDNGTLYIDGKSGPRTYQTDFLTAKTLEVLHRLTASTRPYFLWVTPLAPHSGGPRDPGDPNDPVLVGPSPAPKYRDAFANAPLPKPPSFNEADESDKPGFIRRPPLTQTEIDQITHEYRQELEALLSVDDMVAAICNELKATHTLSKTVIIFTSDNGFMHGEHRIPYGKVLWYEPSIRVPLLMRGPGIPRGKHLKQLVANVDLAPTIAALARAEPGLPQDGRSLLTLLHRPATQLGRGILLEGRPSTNPATYFEGIRTPSYKYVEFQGGVRELYDLANDPFELENQAKNPQFATIEAQLARRLAPLKTCRGQACSRGFAVSLSVGFGRGRHRCVKAPVRAAIGGRAVSEATTARFFLNGHVVHVSSSRPFAAVIARRRVPKKAVVSAYVGFPDGSVVSLARALRGCG